MNDLATTFDASSADAWADRINACWRHSVEAIFAAGRLIAEAKAALPHGEFRGMCADKLPFGFRKAQMLMAIASDPRLANAQRVALLPPNWGALYDMTRLDDLQLETRFVDGTINPAMERKAIATALKQQARATKEQTLGLRQSMLPFVKAGLIYEDYEWDDEVYSRDTGMDRHASNHYPTSSEAHTAEEIHRRRDISSIIDRRGCVMWSWTTNQHLQIALDVMRLRGFEYKSNYCWGKDKISTGRWNRSKHELLLIGTIGSPPCPAPGTQWDSLLIAPKSEHSAKPDCFYKMLEEYFPTLVKVELNARRMRPGWVQWGNEAPETIQPEAARDASDSIPESDAQPQPTLAGNAASIEAAAVRVSPNVDAAASTLSVAEERNSIPVSYTSNLLPKSTADEPLGVPDFLRRVDGNRVPDVPVDVVSRVEPDPVNAGDGG